MSLIKEDSFTTKIRLMIDNLQYYLVSHIHNVLFHHELIKECTLKESFRVINLRMITDIIECLCY